MTYPHYNDVKKLVQIRLLVPQFLHKWEKYVCVLDHFFMCKSLRTLISLQERKFCWRALNTCFTTKVEAKIKMKYAFEAPGNVFRAKTAAIFPIGPKLNSSVSTCGWSVILELSALSREKAFQAHFDLFSIWLTLLWTCLVRLPSILALLFHNMWSTCLPALFPS